MKIKIITFHRAINYGAVLQTYALFNVLKKIVHKCDSVSLFDYRCDKIEKQYNPFILQKGLNKKISGIFCFPFNVIRYIKFRRFIGSNLILSKEFSKDDLFITGSDQVWNYHCSNFDKAYFLNFLNDKKYSYSASFGFSEIPEEKRPEYKELLTDFKKISVREQSGVEIINDLMDREVYRTLDPTLLLDLNEWNKIASINRINERYILVYLMNNTKSIIRFAEKLSLKTGYKLIFIDNNFLSTKIKKAHKSTSKCIVSPEEWVSLFSNASYIVTNSFHGIVFSINFNKQFFLELLPDNSTINTRLENILDIFNLNDRIIIDGEYNNFDKMINYNDINIILDEERIKSMEYLKSIIEENHE